MPLKTSFKRAITWSSMALLVACGGGGGGGTDAGSSSSSSTNTNTSSGTGGETISPAIKFALTGQVEGLFNTGLSVNDGLGNLLNVAGGSLQFAFNNGAAYLETGTAYDLKITAQPAGQVCAITHGTGVASANMMAIKINCATVGLTTASLGDSQLQWGVQTPIKITMKTETGLPVSGALTCQTTDAEALLVAPDCSWAKAMRLGTYKISVLSAAGNAANASVRHIPQRHALQASSQSENTFKALNSDGQTWFWGSGDMGQLAQFGADNALLTSDSARPLQGKLAAQTLMSGIVSVSSGTSSASSLALTDAGEVLSWGGDGMTLGRNFSDQEVPGRVGNTDTGALLKNIVQVQVGDRNAAALRDDGRVFAWGANELVGQGPSATSSLYPKMVMINASTPLADVVQISAGFNFTLALTASGEIYMWGSNQEVGLQNANGSVSENLYWGTRIVDPVTRLPMKDVVSVAAGYAHSLALTAQGQVIGWGKNQYGQLGRGFVSVSFSSLTPDWVKAPLSQGGLLTNIKAIAVGQNHNLALTQDGKVLSWGASSLISPQMGAGTKPVDRRHLPGYVVNQNDLAALTNVLSVSASPYNSYALTTDGDILAWGHNLTGALGNGTYNISFSQNSVPKKVLSAVGTGSLNVGDLSQFKNPHQRYR